MILDQFGHAIRRERWLPVAWLTRDTIAQLDRWEAEQRVRALRASLVGPDEPDASRRGRTVTITRPPRFQPPEP